METDDSSDEIDVASFWLKRLAQPFDANVAQPYPQMHFGVLC
jgi:hypothetical protein